MHYSTFVLFDPNEWQLYAHDIRNVVRERLRRYYREMEVPEYRPPCECMGSQAYRAAGIAFLCRGMARPTPELWARLGLGLKDPDPACDRCGGSGLRSIPITLNPDGQYDYWRLWSFKAWLADTPDLEDTDDDSSGPVGEILNALDSEQDASVEAQLAKLPTAIVTPNTLWFMRNPDAPETWVAEARALLEQYRDCTAVIIDCHF